MSKKPVLGWLCALCISFTAGVITAAEDKSSGLSVEDVFDGIRMRSEALKSVQVVFRYEVYADHSVTEQVPSFWGLPLMRSREFDVRRLGEKMLVTRKIHNIKGYHVDVQSVETFAWDGKKTTGFQQPVGDPSSKLSGSVKPGRAWAFETVYWLTPLEQEVFDLRKPLCKVLDETQWLLSGPEKIGEYSAYKLESMGLWKDNAKLQTWIDPTRDFAPVQTSLTLKFEDGRGDMSEKMCDVRLEKKEGVWVITSASLMFENAREVDPKKRKFATRFSVTDYHVGVKLSDDMFQVEFPKGTRVYDEILKVGYIAGEGVWLADKDGTKFVSSRSALDDIKKLPDENSSHISGHNTESGDDSNISSLSDTNQTSKIQMQVQALSKEPVKQTVTSGWHLGFVAIFAAICIVGAGAYFFHTLFQRKRYGNND